MTSENIVDGRKMKRRIARRESPLDPELLRPLRSGFAWDVTGIRIADPKVDVDVFVSTGVLVLAERTAGMNTRRTPHRMPRANLAVSLELIMAKHSRKTLSWPFSH